MPAWFQNDSPASRFLNKVLDLFLVNLMWILSCVPVVTVGASTTAMYTVLMAMVRGKDYVVWKLFWKAFKENFRQATVIWLIFAAALALLAADLVGFYVLVDQLPMKSVMFIGFVLLSVTVLCALFYVFPLLACFENTVKNTLKNALLFTLCNPIKTVLLVVADVGIVWVLVRSGEAVVLFAGILAALLNAFALKKIFAKFLEPAQPAELEETV